MRLLTPKEVTDAIFQLFKSPLKLPELLSDESRLSPKSTICKNDDLR